MITFLRTDFIAAFFSLSGVIFLAASGVSFAYAQASTGSQYQEPRGVSEEQNSLSPPQVSPIRREKTRKTPVRISSAHKLYRHASIRQTAFTAYPPVPSGIYSSGISPQLPDELTPLMPAFLTGDLVLPHTEPAQPPACELMQREGKNRPLPRGSQFQTVGDYFFPCWGNQP